MANQIVIPIESVQEKIFLIRGSKVLLSHDLARLYEVSPKALIQAVKRNLARFPDDFMFPLNDVESRSLRSQTVTLGTGRGRWVVRVECASTQRSALG